MHLLSVNVSVLQYACLFICLSLIKYQSDHGDFTLIALSGRAQLFRKLGLHAITTSTPHIHRVLSI